MGMIATKMKWLLLGAVMVLAGGASAQTPVDPPSGALDPPPGPQDYIETLPAEQWTFGRLLWQGRDPCTPDFCEAAYNAAPLSILISKEKNCCGDPGYSVTIVGRVSKCSASSYYLAWSKDLDRLTRQGRVALASRHVTQIASSIAAACGATFRDPIPTETLNRLFN